MLGLCWDERLASIPDLLAAIFATRLDAEVLTLGSADVVLSQKPDWPRPVPLLLSERYGPAFRMIGGRGRVQPGGTSLTKGDLPSAEPGPCILRCATAGRWAEAAHKRR